jgi:hypothetical protein
MEVLDETKDSDASFLTGLLFLVTFFSFIATTIAP